MFCFKINVAAESIEATLDHTTIRKPTTEILATMSTKTANVNTGE